ncbi:MAG: NVEALA domain-containing protein [Mediterranea sp.]|nr:NVEALA domain-containing protein [Mediterranea sp.]
MKKGFCFFALMGLLGVVCYYLANNNDRKLSDIQLANIEALASGEDPYINACNTYCVYDVQSVCVLFTNKGYTINCYSMRSWM